MRRFILIIATLAIVFIGLNYSWKYVEKFQEREKDHGFQVALLKFIQDSEESETRLVGLRIDDFLLESSTGAEINLRSLHKPGGDYVLLILSSISTCSACRDDELIAWQAIFEKGEKMPIHLIAAEPEPVTGLASRQLKGIVESLGVTIPLYFDRQGEILPYFGLKQQETPVALLVDKSGRIVSANRPSTLAQLRNSKYREDIYEILQN